MKSILFAPEGKVILAEYFPDREGVYLCVLTPGGMEVYARFTDEQAADKFMDELMEVVHAK